MKLSAPQQLISDDPARFRVAVCGRRFGKSHLAMNEMAKFARIPGSRVLGVAPTYKQCKNIWWEELKSRLSKVRWIKKVNESELIIYLVNGSTITLRSAENRDALRGGKYNFLVMDECANIHPDTWFQVLRPTLSDTGGHALFIGTPQGMNWFYDLWSRALSENDWSQFSFTSLEGGNIPPEEIEAARRDLDERTFEQEYCASFINSGSQIFYAWDNEQNVKPFPGIPERAALMIGMDFNNSPISAVIAQRNASGIHIFDEIEIWGSNTHEMVTEIRQRYPTQQITVFPDATGSRKSTNSQGVSDHLILMNAGFKVIAGKTNPVVNDTITSVNSLMCNGDHQRNLLVDPRCRKTIECINKYSYKPDTRIPDKDGKYDHLADCIRYLTHGLFPYKMNLGNQNNGKTYRKL